MRVNLRKRNFAVYRIERDNVVAFVVDAVNPLFGVLSGIMFDAHFVFFDEKAFDKIFRVAYQSPQPVDKKYESHQRDALLLCAHLAASRDFFIMSDSAMINAAARLKKDWSITVLGIREYGGRHPDA